MELSRRRLVLGSLAMPAWVVSAQKRGPFQALDAATAAEVESLVAQIIPSDDGPGAREAGVIYFIDHVLATFDADKKDAYRKGMEEIQRTRQKMFPSSASIAGLTSQHQIALLRAMEKTEFFELLRKHTVLGFVGSPAYGGNRGEAGWKHIGFEDKMMFDPPFGYYDAEAKR